MAGYDGYFMSNNARAAYEAGERPKGKWIKEEIKTRIPQSKIGIDEMKSYHEYKKEHIGYSDMASLILKGCANDEELINMSRKEREQLTLFNLAMGINGNYNAYIVDEKCKIPEYYELVKVFKLWMKIYDDEKLIKEYYADQILIYRAYLCGTIIQLIS